MTAKNLFDRTQNDDNQPLNLVLECIKTIVADPVINANKKGGKEGENRERIQEILAQFGVDKLLMKGEGD